MTKDMTEAQLAALKNALNVATAAANRMADATTEVDWLFSRRCKDFVADIGRVYGKLPPSHPDFQAKAEGVSATSLFEAEDASNAA